MNGRPLKPGCATCGETDHSRSSSKRCKKHVPRRRKRDLNPEVLDNFDVKTFTIKATLKKYSKNRALGEKIQRDVHELSALFVETSIQINHQLYDWWANNVFPDKPYNFLDFYYNLCSSSKQKYDLHDDYKRLRSTHYGRQLHSSEYRSNMIVAEAKQFATHFHNNLWMNAYRRIRRFFYHFTSDKTAVYQTLHFMFDQSSAYTPNAMLIAQAELYLDYNGAGFYHIRDKNLYHQYIEFFYRLLRFNVANNLKRFKLVPILNHGAHHVHVDSFALYYALCSIKQSPSSDPKSMANSEWFKHFACDRLEHLKRGIKFGYSIQTDGESISFSMDRFREKIITPQKRAKKEKAVDEYNTLRNTVEIQKKLIDNEYANFVGLDPGRRLIFGGIRLNEEGRQLVKIKSKHYRHLTKLYAREKKRRVLVGDEDGDNIEPTDYVAYTTYRLKHFERKQRVYSQAKVTKLKFIKYGDCERGAKELARELIGDHKKYKHKTLVFVGDTSIAANSPIRGYVRTPNRTIMKHLAQIADICRVDEFRTTKLCCRCHRLLSTSKSPHRYQVCKNCCNASDCCCDKDVDTKKVGMHKTRNFNRDVNAGANILYLGYNRHILGLQVADSFSRSIRL